MATISTASFSPPRPASVHSRAAALAVAAAGLAALACGHALGQAAPPAAAAVADDEDAPPAAVRLKLSTSDGVNLAAWYYPAAQPEPEAGKAAAAPPVVILLHDFEGSHESVEPLARDLQTRGIAVVAPDLRGHGDTTGPEGRGGADAKLLKKPDFEAMVMTGGGRVREQANTVGDVEAVRNWIDASRRAGKLDADRLIVVGSGLGAAVAAHWTVLDAKWPDLASGPQGRQVRGLVLVSPAFETRGFLIRPALAAEPVKKDLPVLVIAGTRDADAVKIYDQFKRQRLDVVRSEKRAGQAAAVTIDPRPEDQKRAAAAVPSLFLRQFDVDLTGDRLASFVPDDGRGGGHPAALIGGFLEAVTAPEP